MDRRDRCRLADRSRPGLGKRRPLVHGAIWLLFSVCPAAAGGPATVELQTAANTWQGKPLAHDAQTCWLVDATGGLHEIKLADVTAYRQVSDRFRAETIVDARDRLRRELPRSMEVAARGRYVVGAPTGQAAAYAALLDDVYVEFWKHFSRRQFALSQPEFPLIVLVFASRQEFEAYARQEETPVFPSLRGYYHLRSNRIALYADAAKTGRVDADNDPAPVASAADWQASAFGSIQAGSRDTLIHEATHQLAFNLGLHSRLGETPRWVVEGLAMLFEEDSRRDDTLGQSTAARVNRSRYIWFMNYRRERREKGALLAFLRTDDPFRTSPLDAYSEAWALSFFLVETRPSQYAQYLKAMAARNPLHEYTAEDRLADFQAAFGKDLNWLEGQYQQFLDRLKIE